MGEIFPSSFLPIESSGVPATPVQHFIWSGAQGDVVSHWQTAAASFSSSDSSITLDNTATPPVQYRTNWGDSSLAGALGTIIEEDSRQLRITLLGPLHTPHIRTTAPPSPEASSRPTSAITCKIVADKTCTQPLHDTSWSIRWHLRMHGHKHARREIVQCPWAGCSDNLRWMNIPRHIRSVHLGFRLVCPTCERTFTRSLGLAKHIASKKCSLVVTPPS